MKCNGLSWVNAGSAGFSTDPVDGTSLYIDGGMPYVSFHDTTTGKVNVMSYY